MTWTPWRKRLENHWLNHWISWLTLWFGILPVGWLVATHPWLGVRVQMEAEWLRRYVTENKWDFWPMLLAVVAAGLLTRLRLGRGESLIDPELADSFSQRFEEIHGALDRLRDACCETGAAALRSAEGQRLVVYQLEYLHLCDEEYHWYRSGLLEPEAWGAWVTTIRHYLIREPETASESLAADRRLTPIAGYFMEERAKDAALVCHDFFADPQVRVVWQEVNQMNRETACSSCRVR